MSLFDGLLEDGLPASELEKPLKEIWIAIRVDGNSGDGSRENPYDGSSIAAFDNVMGNLIGTNVLVHLGNGVFHTAGGAGNGMSPVWEPQDGLHIVGAGMFQTVLRLVAPAPPIPTNGSYGISVIGSNLPVKGVQVSDMTIDLDMAHQRISPGLGYPNLMVSAVGIHGTNNRVRRVRVINFGTRSEDLECFPIGVSGPGCLIEDCIAEQPYCGSRRENTCLTLGTSKGLASLNNSPPAVVRNCLVNVDWVNPENGFQTKVTSASRSALIVTVRTQFPHNVCKNHKDYVEVKGAAQTEYNGRWEVDEPAAPDSTSRELKFKLLTTPSAEPTPGFTVEQSFQPTLRIISVDRITDTSPPYTVYLEYETATPHWRVAGNEAVISGAELVGIDDLYNGTQKIVASGLTATKFRVEATSVQTGEPTGELWLDRRTPRPVRVASITTAGVITTHGPHSYKTGEWCKLAGFAGSNFDKGYYEITVITTPADAPGRNVITITPPASPTLPSSYALAKLDVNYQAISTQGSIGTTMERNRVWGAMKGGSYNDAWVNSDTIIRKNYYYNVYHGPWLKFGAPDYSFLPSGAATATPSRRGDVMLISPDLEIDVESISDFEPPTFFLGMVVQVFKSGMTPVYTTVKSWNSGMKRLVLVAVAGFSVTDGIFFWPVMQQKRLVIEDNLIDLSLHPLPVGGTNYEPPSGIAAGYDPNPLSVQLLLCKDLVVRGNILRTVDNLTDPHWGDNRSALTFYNVARATIENNIANGFEESTPATYRFGCGICQSVKAFNNQTNAGKRVRLAVRAGYSGPFMPNVSYIEQLEDEIEDWLLNV